MKKTLLLIALSAMSAAGASAQVIINEVYSGGGSGVAGTSYTRDFVELYNPSAVPFNLSGYTLQYASSSGVFTNTIVLFGTGSVIGGTDYLSIYTGGAGAAGTALTAGPGPGNVTYVVPSNGGASLANSSGAVRLYNTATNATIDVLGYGAVTNNSTVTDPKYEGTAAGSPTNTVSSLARNQTTFADTNNNLADFAYGPPTPNGGNLSVVVAAPEPSTWACLIGGLGAAALLFRRRRSA